MQRMALLKCALWEAWRNSMTAEECIEHVVEYVSVREDEVLEDGLWRTRFARKVNEHSQQTNDTLSSLRDAQAEVHHTQRVLERRQQEAEHSTAERLDRIESLLSRVVDGLGIPGGGDAKASIEELVPDALRGQRIRKAYNFQIIDLPKNCIDRQRMCEPPIRHGLRRRRIKRMHIANQRALRMGEVCNC